MKASILGVVAVGTLLLAGPVSANPITFDAGTIVNPGTGRSLSATATFDVVGGNLQVVLTNTGLTTALSPSDLLAAVFFNISGNPLLSYVGGTAESLVNSDGTPNGGSLSVGTNWNLAYNGGSALGGAVAPFVTQKYGFGGAGFGVPGLGGTDGPDYLLVTAAFNGGGNLPSNKDPYIQDQITLLASGIPYGFDPATTINDVRFQWGTALDEPSVNDTEVFTRDTAPVPEPASLILLGTGLIAGARRWRKRQTNTEDRPRP